MSIDVVIRTGSLELNDALGVGGYPRGRIVELFGPDSSGKTALCLHAICEVQRNGGVAALIDTDHVFDPSAAQAIGVELQELLLSQPESVEHALEIAATLARSGVVALIVVGSIDLRTSVGTSDDKIGLQARRISQALRKLTALIHRTGTTVMVVNHQPPNIGAIFGTNEPRLGSNALKFYASIRVDVRRTDQQKMRAKVVKNKCAAPFKKAEFVLAGNQ